MRKLADDHAQHALSHGRGELVVVLGPSGSGKTTLLNVVGAIESATHGSVQVAGSDLTGCTELGSGVGGSSCALRQRASSPATSSASREGAPTPLLRVVLHRARKPAASGLLTDPTGAWVTQQARNLGLARADGASAC